MRIVECVALNAFLPLVTVVSTAWANRLPLDILSPSSAAAGRPNFESPPEVEKIPGNRVLRSRITAAAPSAAGAAESVAVAASAEAWVLPLA